MTNPNRIEINPKILSGKPVIKGTRIPVHIIIQMLRDAQTFEEIIRGYPRLTIKDIQAVFDYSLYIIQQDISEEIITH